MLKTFNKANLDINSNNLNYDFKYLFLTPPFLIYSINLGKTNNLLTIINRN